jgi:hypothetical protein
VTLIDDQVAKAIADPGEDALYTLWFDLEDGREARIAALATEEDVDDVREITAAQNRIVHEVNRRRLPDRIAALKADDDPARLLPPRTAAVAERARPQRYPYGRRGWRRI